MSKAILNRRDRMIWDNSFKPNGVDDTLDLVSEHIEDIVEDHIEGIGESTTGYSLDYKVVADITFEQEANAINIDFDDEYRKLIIKYSHPAMSSGSSATKNMFVKTEYGSKVLQSDLFESTSDRTEFIKVDSYGIAIYALSGVSGSLTSESIPSSISIRFLAFDVTHQYTLKGVLGSFNVPVGAKLLVLGVK